MKSFEHVTAETLEEAFERFQGGWNTRLSAGGTDLLHEMKNGIITPIRIINIKPLEELSFVREENGGLEIGALTPVDEIENNVLIAENAPLLSKAASFIATPQLRNMGTIAGNICQRPRCWYYRNRETLCLRKGGDRCFAVTGENQYHAILGGGPCHIVCPSDLAPALVALKARVYTMDPQGEREVPLEEFFVGPKENPNRGNILAPNDIIEKFVVPSPSNTGKKTVSDKAEIHSVFLKARERESWDFALASIAMRIIINKNKVEEVSVVFGGVAPTPWRAKTAETYLAGKVLTHDTVETVAESAAEAGVDGARPLRDNDYKARLLQGLIKKALYSIVCSY